MIFMIYKNKTDYSPRCSHGQGMVGQRFSTHSLLISELLSHISVGSFSPLINEAEVLMFAGCVYDLWANP